MDREKLERTLQRFMRLLVDRGYTAIAAWTQGRHLSAEVIEEAVAEYPGELVFPACSNLDTLLDGGRNLISLNDSAPEECWVDLPLWTVEEGRSDLSASLLLADTPGDYCSIELHDIHVL